MRVSNSFRKARGNRQQGYILLTLILFAVLLAIGAAAMLPEFTFQMKRDREEEMIHRGVQYSRAVRRYYKKLGRYPNTVEELQSTNNTHFLRKKYKDPVTGKRRNSQVPRPTSCAAPWRPSAAAAPSTACNRRWSAA